MLKKSKKQKEKDKEIEKSRERSMLKLTLDIVVKENSQLKAILEDMKINVAENKLQLQETIKKITDKDTAVAMLSTQIDQLKQKFNEMQSKQKLISVNNNYGSEETFPFKNTETAYTTSPHFIKNKNCLKNYAENNKNLEENNQKEQNEKLCEENVKKQKSFVSNQQEIYNTILNLKRDVQFLREKINENKNNKIFYQYNLNLSGILKENEINKMDNLFLNNNNDDGNNLFFLVGNDGRVFKIKKRNDLSKNNFMNKIELDFNKRFNEEIIDLREKIENYNNSEESEDIDWDSKNKIRLNNFISKIKNDMSRESSNRYKNTEGDSFEKDNSDYEGREKNKEKQFEENDKTKSKG